MEQRFAMVNINTQSHMLPSIYNDARVQPALCVAVMEALTILGRLCCL